MREIVEFPDAVENQLDYLAPLLTVDVKAIVPNPRPPQFVVVERVGGGALSVAHDSPLITYKCIAPTVGEAGALISRVRALVRAQPGFVNDLGGPVFMPDPDDGLPRYQYTAQLLLRGTA